MKFEFQRGTSVKCHDCIIAQDEVCNVNENAVSFELILSLPSSVNSLRSQATITVDDSREPECCEWYPTLTKPQKHKCV